MTSPTPRQTPCVHPVRTKIARLSTADRIVEDCQLCGQRLAVDPRTGKTTEEITGR